MINGLNINYIASYILDIFRETGLDDCYIQSKLEKFENHDNKYETLIWSINLDQNNQERLAEKMGIEFRQLLQTIEILRAI